MELTDLPIEGCIEALRSAMSEPGLAVLQAEPGAGKTTVVPLRMLHEPWVAGGKILLLEPRRLATRAAATRMSAMVGERVGKTIGYVTRDERRVSAETRIEVVTEGILTRRLQNDPELTGVAMVIFDEFHERSLQADLGLALALDVRRSIRDDLRILVMSATIDTAEIAGLLGGEHPAPIIAAEGRTFPVDIRWKPMAPAGAGKPGRPRHAARGRARASGARIETPVAEAVRLALQEPGDVLVFLPGAATINRTADLLRGAGVVSAPDGEPVDVHRLFGALTPAEQDAALRPAQPGRRKVVLSTDIAETSLTVEGVRTVIDSGQVKNPQFDARTGMTRLLTGVHSQASADQRAGRAGRVAPGVAIRLWSKMEHAARPKFTAPEITRVDVSGLLLELGSWGVADPSSLPFLDLPPEASIAEGRELLSMLGALDGAGRLSTAGHAMARLPLHPRLARMVHGANEMQLGAIGCVLAALLEDRDILRGRPGDVSADLADRIELILDRGRRHPQADGGAVKRARDRAGDIARRAGIDGGATTRHGVDLAGAVLALAYPDRVAQQRQGKVGKFRLRSGSGAVLQTTDHLAAEEMLVVADLDGRRNDAQIRLALATAKQDIVVAFADDIEEVATLTWDTGRDDLVARVEQRLGALRLGMVERRPEPGPRTVAGLLQRVRDTNLEVLGWTEKSRELQHRLRFVHAARPTDWPDLSDATLLDTLDDWLAPFLDRATGRKQLERVDLHTALWNQVGYHRQDELERLTPVSLALPTGRDRRIDYASEKPVVRARVQQLFGVTEHPTVLEGAVPIVLELLSPADRPVQITADLPGFWQGSWVAVKKDLAGRYPKHSWPDDPAAVAR